VIRHDASADERMPCLVFLLTVIPSFLHQSLMMPMRTPRKRRTMVALVQLVVAATLVVATQASMVKAQPVEPPTMLLGAFTDDYGYHYRITRESFEMLPRTRYRIVEWNSARQFLIARADSTAALPGGQWLRIDWMELSAMAPYTWAYCFTAYDAPTADSARATPSANRSAPRTGCAGHPFSRMKRTNGE
jgi:hypothetical protein